MLANTSIEQVLHEDDDPGSKPSCVRNCGVLRGDADYRSMLARVCMNHYNRV